MADHSLIETLVSGVLTGGATASTAVFGFFRETRRRLSELDVRLGSVDEKRGVAFSLVLVQEGLRVLEESVRKIRKDVDNWHERPPEWAESLIRKRVATISNEQYEELERSSHSKFRDIEDKLQEIDDDISKLSRKLGTLEGSLRESDSARAREVSSVRESVAALNGLLRGLHAIIETPRR